MVLSKASHRCQLSITIRQPRPDDRPLIIDSWQHCFLGTSRDHPEGQGPLSHMRRSEYFTDQERVINTIFKQPDTVVLVATWPREDNHILGWVCGCPQARVLHFLYVTQLWREKHIGTRLMAACFAGGANLEGPADFPGAPVTVTHWTWRVPYYERRWRLRYNPYLLLRLPHG